MIAPRHGQLGSTGGHRLGARPGANLVEEAPRRTVRHEEEVAA